MKEKASFKTEERSNEESSDISITYKALGKLPKELETFCSTPEMFNGLSLVRHKILVIPDLFSLFTR